MPRRLLQEKRKTIGMRVPSNPIAQALLEALGEPMLSTSLMLQAANLPNPIRKKLRPSGKTGGLDYSRRLSRAETNNGY